MIANPNWFKRRKYSGWGVTPNSWQAWVYVLAIVIIVFAIQFTATLFALTLKTQIILISGFIGLVLLDTISMLKGLPKDEREIFHEAVAERNVTWFIIMVLALGLTYQTYLSVASGALHIDPFILIALIGGTIVKAISNWYLLDK